MLAGKDRHGRKENPRREQAAPGRLPGRALRAATLALLASAAVAIPAQATTGGVSPAANGGANASDSDVAFSSMRTAGATWYGPGLYGNKTACGETLLPNTIGVAHRSLPCGTTVK